MATLSRKEFKEQMNSLREEMHSMRADFNEKLSGYVTFSEKLEQARERERAERDKRLEALIERSEINTERATRLAERAEETAQQMAQKAMESNRRMEEMVMQSSRRTEEMVMQSSRRTEEMVMQSGQRAEALVGQAAQKVTESNRHYWLSTLTGVVATVLSVAALVVGAVYATRPSNSNSAQMALTAFQQGQQAALIPSVPPK